MGAQAKGTFSIEQWEQSAYDETEPSLYRASVKERYEGDITADGVIEYLMTNLSDGTAKIVGQFRLTGSIGGKSGSLVIHESGEYNGHNTAQGLLTIVPGSGTGDFTGITGHGAYVATHGEESVEFAGRNWAPTSERLASYIIDYDFE